MLKLRFTQSERPDFWVLDSNYLIGRGASCQLQLEDESISERHARIVRRGESYLLIDCSETQQTRLNGKKIGQARIACGDKLGIGHIELEIINPLKPLSADTPKWALIANSGPLRGKEIPLVFSAEKPSLTLGRSASCDIVIPGKHVSRTHASLSLRGERLALRDMGSANGSFVNNERINDTIVHPGEELRLDVFTFLIFGPDMDLPQATTQSMRAISEKQIAEFQLNEEKQTKLPDNAEKLWQTRASSPGNRFQEDLYKRHWAPYFVAAAILLGFCAILLSVFL